MMLVKGYVFLKLEVFCELSDVDYAIDYFEETIEVGDESSEDSVFAVFERGVD